MSLTVDASPDPNALDLSRRAAALFNKSVETNRRPASPFNAGRQFESALCAPPSLSAAVAHLWRSRRKLMQDGVRNLLVKYLEERSPESFMLLREAVAASPDYAPYADSPENVLSTVGDCNYEEAKSALLSLMSGWLLNPGIHTTLAFAYTQARRGGRRKVRVRIGRTVPGGNPVDRYRRRSQPVSGSAHCGREVGFTITTADERMRKIFEPGAPPIAKRIEAMEQLHTEGIRTFAMIAPVHPGAEKLPELLRDNADHVLVDRLNYHYADAVYKKFGMQWARDENFFRKMGEELRKAFEKNKVPCQVLF